MASTITESSALHLVVGFSAGSASDDLARAIAPKLSQVLGRSVTIDLMPGDAGARAARFIIEGAPDGNILMLATFGTHAISPILRPALGYDPLKDFETVSLATHSSMIIAVYPSLPVATVSDLIELATRTTLTYASSSTASAPYLAGMLLQKQANILIEHVDYSDTRLMYEDLVSGKLAFGINNPMSMLPFVREGRLRPIAVTGARRISALPLLPTVSEGGLTDYAVSNWLGIVAPPRTAKAVVKEQSRAIRSSLKSPALRQLLRSSGMEIVASSPSVFARHITDELRKWAWIRGYRLGTSSLPKDL